MTLKPEWLDEALDGHPIALRNEGIGYVRHYETSHYMDKPLLGVIIGQGKVHPAAWSILGEYSTSKSHNSDILGLHLESLEFLGWDVLNEFTRYIAKDADGCWHGYTSRPIILEGYSWWAPEEGEDTCDLSALKKELFPECDWRNSLIERPKEVK